jgi:hypothetical protein
LKITIENSVKKQLVRALYVVVPLLFVILIVGHEFFWHYEPSLHIKRVVKIRNSKMQEKTIIIEEDNPSPVDTFRREIKNSESITKVKLWLDFAQRDSFSISITGKYFSDFRPVHLSADSSTEIMLIPNSFQGLPVGWASIIYLKNDSVLAKKEFSGYFIGDMNNDGAEEVNIPGKGWMKLDTKTGEWISL